jgi:hypothetical protein
MSEELWAWWEERLNDDLRQQLLDLGTCDPSGDLALVLWRTSGRLHVVEPETWTVDADPNRWRLTPEVADFVAMRRYEQLHPE